ncbi:hypothetical protein J4558_11640 [Leptolyngbya sp. 15MV]|nr:hypothetical protein J4558_11640 [Leptolyngbya sp. 15MV]
MHAQLEAIGGPGGPYAHPYGDGRTGPRVADLLLRVNPHDPRLLRKRCVY